MLLAAQLVVCTLAAYAFARYRFAGADIAFALVLVQLMIMPDILLVETTFDTLNAKAAAFAIDEVFEEDDVRLPLWVSGTIVDLSGRTLTGQTVEAYWTSMKHARPFAIGFNCSLGSSQLRP